MIVIGLLSSENRSPLWGFHFGQTHHQYSIIVVGKAGIRTRDPAFSTYSNQLSYNPDQMNQKGKWVSLPDNPVPFIVEYKYTYLFSICQIFIAQMLVLFLHIAIYFISVYAVGKYFKLAYSKKGIWNNLHICTLEKILIVLPSINTAFAIFFWVTENPIREEHRLEHLKLNGRKHHV